MTTCSLALIFLNFLAAAFAGSSKGTGTAIEIQQIDAARIAQNELVVPQLSCDCEDSKVLHDYLWKLLWLRHRFARGTEKYFLRIPSVSFQLAEDFFGIRTDPINIIYPSLEQMYVKVSIVIQQNTDTINELRAQDGNPQPLTPDQAAQDAHDLADIILHENGICDPQDQQQQKSDKMPSRHYHKYIIEAWYTCRDPPLDDPKATKCEDWQYYLDNVHVQVTYHPGTATPLSLEQSKKIRNR